MERIQAKAKAQAAAKGAVGAAAGAGAAAADGSGAADPAQHALIQGLTGLAVNGKQQPGGAHGRSNSTAFTTGSGAGASSASSQNRHAATPSGWGFPALFGRPTPASSAASSSASSQPGGRDLSFKRPSTTGDSFSMEDHELYSGIVSNGTAYSKHGGAGASASTLLSTGAAASSAHWHLKSLEPSERELVETEVIKVLMESYFRIVRKTVADQVPKAIICFLVTRVKKELQAQLVAELYQASLLDTLLAEADDIAEKRESCKELLAILERAMAILNTARDFNAMSSV
jgi:hypothetical protein